MEIRVVVYAQWQHYFNYDLNLAGTKSDEFLPLFIGYN